MTVHRHRELSNLLGQVYGLVTDTVDALEDDGFRRPTRAEGWTIRDLLFHQLLDAQRALVALASPTATEADVDDVTYWEAFRPDGGDGGAGHARFVRAATAAYDAPAVLVEHWRTTAGAAVRAVATADPAGRVETQGHVIAVPDLISTLVLEATVHHLDLTLHLAAPRPPADALVLSRTVLEQLYGAPLPEEWDDTQALLKGTGRVALDDRDRELLGERAAELPLLG